MKKILVIGATGAMGTYLVPELIRRGYAVDAASLDDMSYTHPNLRHIKENMFDPDTLKSVLANGYDAIVDFLIYNKKEKFEAVMPIFLEATKHYIYLSTYRIYAGEYPITEESPRLIDVTDDEVLLNSGDYCIYKAEGENVLRASSYDNWTIIRPAITFSKRRFQLTTLEASVLMYRIFNNKTVVLPEAAMDIQATMTWAGDVAKMIAGLLFNPKAYKEAFTVSTNEHHTWREVAGIYERVCGLKYITASTDDYVYILSGTNNVNTSQQLVYDRCFNRVIDNSKILDATGMKEQDLTPIEIALRMEFANLMPGDIPHSVEINERMDEYLKAHGIDE